MPEPAREEFVRLRKEIGATQKEIAARLDRSLNWVSRVEQGSLPCPAYAVLAMRYLRTQAKRKR